MHTIRYRQRRLPHWEVAGGRYFITVRCADSLPSHAVIRLRELHEELSLTAPASASFTYLQSQVFLTLEKYLDTGFGVCPLNRPEASRIIQEEFEALSDWQISIPHYTIMPNHWHALLVPANPSIHSISHIMKRLKGRTAKRIRQVVEGSGPFWQSEWFDRWVRNEAEWARLVNYIRRNPMKAGLVQNWQDHPWTR